MNRPLDLVLVVATVRQVPPLACWMRTRVPFGDRVTLPDRTTVVPTVAVDREIFRPTLRAVAASADVDRRAEQISATSATSTAGE